MEEQKKVINKGGTMRLGAYPCTLEKGSTAAGVYGRSQISERHRHRFEFNNDFRAQLESAGMKCSGINDESGLVEVVELEDHPWFVGVQFHPEYKSTVKRPAPLFIQLVKAAIAHKESKNGK